MIKKILFFSALMVSSSVYAQSCDTANVNPVVNIDIKNLVIDYSKNVGFLDSNNKKERHVPLGMYTAPKTFGIQPAYTLKRSPVSGGFCAQNTSVTVNFVVSPMIYISKEAQQFTCTSKRVYQHEMTHYNIEMNVMKQMNGYISNLLKSVYAAPLNAPNEDTLNTLIAQRNQQVMKNIEDTFVRYTDPYHSQLDTVDNYKKESEACSELENVALSRQLRATPRVDTLR